MQQVFSEEHEEMLRDGLRKAGLEVSMNRLGQVSTCGRQTLAQSIRTQDRLFLTVATGTIEGRSIILQLGFGLDHLALAVEPYPVVGLGLV